MIENNLRFQSQNTGFLSLDSSDYLLFGMNIVSFAEYALKGMGSSSSFLGHISNLAYSGAIVQEAFCGRSISSIQFQLALAVARVVVSDFVGTNPYSQAVGLLLSAYSTYNIGTQLIDNVSKYYQLPVQQRQKNTWDAFKNCVVLAVNATASTYRTYSLASSFIYPPRPEEKILQNVRKFLEERVKNESLREEIEQAVTSELERYHTPEELKNIERSVFKIMTSITSEKFDQIRQQLGMVYVKGIDKLQNSHLPTDDKTCRTVFYDVFCKDLHDPNSRCVPQECRDKTLITPRKLQNAARESAHLSIVGMKTSQFSDDDKESFQKIIQDAFLAQVFSLPEIFQLEKQGLLTKEEAARILTSSQDIETSVESMKVFASLKKYKPEQLPKAESELSKFLESNTLELAGRLILAGADRLGTEAFLESLKTYSYFEKGFISKKNALLDIVKKDPKVLLPLINKFSNKVSSEDEDVKNNAIGKLLKAISYTIDGNIDLGMKFLEEFKKL